MTVNVKALVGWSVVAAGPGLGLLLTAEAVRQPGYVAGYRAILALVIGTGVLLLGLGLSLLRNTRWLGIRLALAAVLLVLVNLSMMRVAASLGLWSRPMVAIGPDQPATMVALFDEAITPQGAAGFVETVLSQPHPGGGHSHRPGIRSVLFVTVGKHSGYAVTCSPSATAEQLAALRARITGSPLVWRLYEDVVPAQISLAEPTKERREPQGVD